MLISFLIILFAVFLVTVLISRRLIPKLKSLKMGQPILDIGPRWHKSKEGTPTMGGLAFIAAAIVVTFCHGAFAVLTTDGIEPLSELLPFYITLLYAVLSGLIGVIDDRTKIVKTQNEGLTASQKFLLQLLTASLYVIAMRLCGAITTEIKIPFFDISLDLGIFYYVIAILLLTGMVNSVNLTDGIDGLASAETCVVGAFFALVAFTLGNEALSAAAAITIGAALGFLVYNFYPARVFMGDTGSLFLGAMVVGMAFLADNPLIVLFAGLMYIIETASVMLQTTYFKFTRIFCGEGRRIFKMSPIHHHFEMCGWNEVKIVSVFSVMALLFCAITYILEYAIR